MQISGSLIRAYRRTKIRSLISETIGMLLLLLLLLLLMMMMMQIVNIVTYNESAFLVR